MILYQNNYKIIKPKKAFCMSIVTKLSKMWTKVLNLEESLFPAIKEELRLETLSTKEQKLIKILDFAEIEKHITVDFYSNISNITI